MSDAATVRPKRLGHLALRVRDLQRSTAFYRDVLGLDVRGEFPFAAFLGASAESSHEIALFPVGEAAPGPEEGRVGLYHMAWEMASFEDLAALNERLKAMGVRIGGYSERQCNVMFFDPDGNEIEAIWEPTPELMPAAGTPLPRLQP